MFVDFDYDDDCPLQASWMTATICLWKTLQQQQRWRLVSSRRFELIPLTPAAAAVAVAGFAAAAALSTFYPTIF